MYPYVRAIDHPPCVAIMFVFSVDTIYDRLSAKKILVCLKGDDKM